MWNIIVHDLRVGGHYDVPQGGCLINVNEKSKIANLVDLLAAQGEASRGYMRLFISAHGSPASVQICEEGLNWGTLDKFYKLANKIRGGIEISACEVATHDRRGNGMGFCGTLAVVTRTSVRAPLEVQKYSKSGWPTTWGRIDDGAWEGNVITWGPDGKILKAEMNPKN